jgi:hypothetical protein
MCTTPGGEVKTDTWDRFCKSLGRTVEDTPFDKPTQDAFFVWCLQQRKALQLIIDGKLRAAIDICSYEWASFPPGRYGQPTVTYDALERVYLAYGGKLSAVPADVTPAPTPTPEPQPTREAPRMAIPALIAMFGPMIVEMIPTIAKLFDRKTETPAKIEAATKVLDTIVRATDTPNVQAAVEKMQSDPAALTAARNAVVTEPTIMALLEVGGGIEKAREHVHVMAQLPPWRNVALLVSAVLVPLIYIVVCAVVFGEGWSDEMRSVVVTAIVTGLLGSITGFFLGSSFGSARKTDMINERTQ